MQVAAALNCPVSALTRLHGGGNSRLYRATLADGRSVAVKSYPATSTDTRNRLDTEFNALTFLRGNGETEIPYALARNDAIRIGIYEWVNGEPACANLAAINWMAGFCSRLFRLKGAPGALNLRLASEACLSADDLSFQISRRLARLMEIRGDTELSDFLRLDLQPAVARLRLNFAAPRPEHWTLSPSDFGTHNMLLRDDAPVFLDMEYFGWDDPVKLTADVIWHPGMNLPPAFGLQFIRQMREIHSGADKDFQHRLDVTLPAYGLRWTLIVLNEFLPERWAVRFHARRQDQSASKARQLSKARTLLTRVNELF